MEYDTFKDGSKFATIALDDVMNLLNVALNRVHDCAGLTTEEQNKLAMALCDAKTVVATTTNYVPRNY